MNSLAVIEKEKYAEIEVNSVSFSYINSLSVKILLDNIAAIISNEYINLSKQNPEIFLDKGGNL